MQNHWTSVLRGLQNGSFIFITATAVLEIQISDIWQFCSLCENPVYREERIFLINLILLHCYIVRHSTIFFSKISGLSCSLKMIKRTFIRSKFSKLEKVSFYSLFILVMFIPCQLISNPHDLVKNLTGKMNLWWRELLENPYCVVKYRKCFPVYTCDYWSNELEVHMTEVSRLSGASLLQWLFLRTRHCFHLW